MGDAISINYAQVESLLNSYQVGIATLVQQAQQHAAGRRATLRAAGANLAQTVTTSGTSPAAAQAEQTLAGQAQQIEQSVDQADVPVGPVPTGQAGAQPSTPGASGMDDPDRQRASHIFNN